MDRWAKITNVPFYLYHMSNNLFSEIQTILQHYAPSSPLEQGYVEECKDLLRNGPQALWADFFTPGHITASAFVLSPDRHNVLMIFHHKLQRWLQPGGHLEASDGSLLEAAQREIAEETGIEETELLVDGLFDLDIHEIPARKTKPAHLHFDMRLLLRATTSDVVTTPEAPQISWIDLEHAREQFDEASLLRPVEKVWALYS